MKEEILFIDLNDYKPCFLFNTAYTSLPEELLNFLLTTKQGIFEEGVPFSIPKASYDLMLSHTIIRSGKDELGQWNIIEPERKGKGSFGTVNASRYTFNVQQDLDDEMPEAYIRRTNDVIKIQTYHNEREAANTYKQVSEEGHNLKGHHIAVKRLEMIKNKIFLLMEDCGVNLKTFFRSKAFKYADFDTRLSVVLGVCHEVDLLKKSVIHRDIKPENFCIKKTGPNKYKVTLVDFGLAERVSSNGSGDMAGTALYMAPDEESSHASDIYSLAGVIGEILGATNIHKHKYKIKNRDLVPEMPYCFDGIENILMPDDDPSLKKDILKLLNAMQDKDADKRPNIDLVYSFFRLIQARRAAYQTHLQDWCDLQQGFNQLYQKMGIDKKPYDIKASQFKPQKGHIQGNYIDSILSYRSNTIYHAIANLPANKDHYDVIAGMHKINTKITSSMAGVYRAANAFQNMFRKEEIVFEQKTAQHYDNEKPFANLSSVKDAINANKAYFNACDEVLKAMLGNIKVAFKNTNSDGIVSIEKILASPNSSLIKLQKIQAIAQKKITKDLWYRYSHFRCCCKKGRQDNAEALYNALAKIESFSTPEDCLAKEQLSRLSVAILQGKLLDYNNSKKPISGHSKVDTQETLQPTRMSIH